jgi:hypothetical protein
MLAPGDEGVPGVVVPRSDGMTEPPAPVPRGVVPPTLLFWFEPEPLEP